jgi:glycosyltransferase involved in cell wall biosynthesis
MKLIGIMSPCFNEQDSVEQLYERTRTVFEKLPQYSFELTFIDNASTDQTLNVIRKLAQKDKRVKAIVNNRNFGPLRSPYHCLLQVKGDAIISVASDLQDPPELIPKLLELWEGGEKLVAAVKTQSNENPFVYVLRTLYYKALNKIADVELIEHFTGFGLYDRVVVEELRKTNDRFPYVRGLVSELGFKAATVPYVQPNREHGKSRLRLFDLYDIAMSGLTTHSILPMRCATFLGFILALLSLVVALFYFVYKLLYWTSFDVGVAPLVIGMFGIFSVQLIFIGLLGEYIGATHLQVLNRPYVVERERINFEQAAEHNAELPSS